MGKRVAISGNHSIAEGVRLAKVDVVAAYPITPQTPMVEKVADFINQGRLDARYIAVESEHSALTAVVGASVMGTRVFTASAGAGLALMHEIVGVASGNRLPIVMGIANRSLPSPWSLQADHSDSMAERDLGWIQLYAASCQEALDYTLLAYRIAEEVRLPVMVCIDGFFLTHTTEAVDLPDQADVDQFLPAFERGDIYLDPDDPMTINQLNSEATFTELKYRHNEALNSVVDLFPHVAKEFEERFGRKHSLCTAVGCEDADVVVVTLGSSSGTARKVAGQMRADGQKIGTLQVSCFRPFPKQEVIDHLKHAKAVAVVDRSWALGTDGPLAQEVKSAFYSAGLNVPVYNFVGGLGGRDLSEATVKRVIGKALELKEQEEQALYPIWIDVKEEAK